MVSRTLAPLMLVAAALCLGVRAWHAAAGLAALTVALAVHAHLTRPRPQLEPVDTASGEALRAAIVEIGQHRPAAPAPLAGLPVILRVWVVPVTGTSGTNLRLRVLSCTQDDARNRTREYLDDNMPGRTFTIGTPEPQGTPTFGVDTAQEATG